MYIVHCERRIYIHQQAPHVLCVHAGMLGSNNVWKEKVSPTAGLFLSTQRFIFANVFLNAYTEDMKVHVCTGCFQLFNILD